MNFTRDQITEAVLRVVAEQASVGASTLNSATVLVDLDLDSLDLAEITMELEEEFDVIINDESLPHLSDATTIADIITMVENHLKEPNNG